LLVMFFISNKTQNYQADPDLLPIKIGDSIINAEIVDTPEKRALGLSGRKNLPAQGGMLFVFDKENYHTFWMKDMNFPLDMIWIGADMKIVDVFKNATPDSYPKYSIKPDYPAQYVLETNAGWLDKNKINIGDKINLPLKVKRE